MSEKLQSEIIKIELDDATFQGTKTVFTPTYVNFFFGNNGTGKSTIAKAIKSGRGVAFADGKQFEDYIPLVYNQEFINDNMRSYHDMKGIFTFDEVNSDLQDEFDQLNNQLGEARKTKASAESAKSEAESKLIELDEKSMRNQFSSLKDLRNKFGKLIPSRFSTSKTLIPEIRRHLNKAAMQDEVEMQRQYNAIYGSDAKEYTEFPTIPDTMVLDTVEGEEILNVVIANTAETEMAQFLKRIDATEWMRQAHERYHSKTEGRCPYCYRMLPEDFEQKFMESFDDQYDKNLQKLNAFLKSYRDKANALYLHISRLPEEIYPGADEKAYNEKLAVLKDAVSENIDAIKSKIAEPSKKITLAEVASVLEDVSKMITAINKMIRTNNEAYNTKTKKISELRENLFCYMAYTLQRDFKMHDQSRKMIIDAVEVQKKIIKNQSDLMIELKDKLRGKQGSVKDTTVAMKKINEMLRDANFQGFEMCPHIDASQPAGEKPINYEVVRTSTGKVAEDLSEGEKTLLLSFTSFKKYLAMIALKRIPGRK